MRKSFIAVLFLFIVLSVYAHPASKVNAEFNMETKKLTILFEHKVSDTSKHYISEVKVYRNKKEIMIQKIKGQETAVGGNLYYRIPDAKPGDKLNIYTVCNKFGKKSFELKL